MILFLILKTCSIEDCGEILAGQDDGFIQDDGTGDLLADCPDDSDLNFDNVRIIFYLVVYASILAITIYLNQ